MMYKMYGLSDESLKFIHVTCKAIRAVAFDKFVHSCE